MGRHATGAQPAAPWPRRLAAAALRWAGRLALGALTGGAVLGALHWTGITGRSATALAAAAAVLVVVAAALASTVPPPPQDTDDRRAQTPDGWSSGPRSHGR
ncbi:hypothetical protein GC089_11755 [Cellulomonas sp. JZ18]|uniref:hypothetical protein n=1 Tax=Cellulomonas sp. JZ18 TaxID=2654191 RepID=UPI0012D3C70A|nr:hypothetical protein [Cellulomonas sp. JZ18]QGQ19773.1 hypothetical protein GC089_11755 [Cellulomonas sp. JZ18]